MLQVKEWPKLYNAHIEHVMIQSELKYSFEATYLGVQRPGFEVEPSPNAMVRVFYLVKPLQWYSSSSNPNPEPF
jgi:hypothetical protein